MKFKLVAVIAFSSALLCSCVKHDFSVVNYECNSDDGINYDQDVDNIIKSNCAISGCHNGDNGESRNWLVFENFQAKSATVRDRITRPADQPGHMPASGSLTKNEIEHILCWIDQGAEDN